MEEAHFFSTLSPVHAHQLSPDKRLPDSQTNEPFLIEDLLDFPTDDATIVPLDIGTSTESSTVTVVDNTSCNSSVSTDIGAASGAGSGHFTGDLCVPYDDMAELEWLSNFVEESFSSEELQHIQPPSSPAQVGPGPSPKACVPAKARSKRSRVPPGNWAARLLLVSSSAASSSSSSSSTSDSATKRSHRKREAPDGGDGRRCLHCATDKTPQWRTGPMGPKTLCNACGVRYKSGRLVPEYRPASSPTFVMTKHSNSHRKVLELRRQKEMQQQQFIHQGIMFDVSNGEDYLIHQHVGPTPVFRQLT